MVVRVKKIGSREFLIAGRYMIPTDSIKDIYLNLNGENIVKIFLVSGNDFTFVGDAAESLREFLTR